MARAAAALILAALLAGTAHAQGATEIWKCKSRDGKWTYTNDRNEAEKLKCETVTRQVNVAPATKAPAGSSGFPRETTEQRASARERQREVLEKELTTEQSALAKAKQDLAAQEAVRTGDERNYARVQERLQPYKDSVETHEKNIEALKRELSNLYR
jgi:chromosome segregation ATPase